MSALSGVWTTADPARALSLCRGLATAQAAFGPHGRDCAGFGPFAAARNLHRTVAEDDFDRQPLELDGRWVLVADARIDNREELGERIGLTAGELARTSDSELLLRCWSRWRADTVDQLNGDYAFAVFDRAEGCLWLARDPLGQRPLHYRRHGPLFAFASMAQALGRLAETPCAVDEIYLAEFVSDLPMRGERSFFEAVRRVEPGELLLVRAGTESTAWRWRPRPMALALPTAEQCGEALREELDRAVARKASRRRGGLACHLSSGWDSSAVATSAAVGLRGSGERLLALTAAPADEFDGNVPPGRFADESPLAAATAALHETIDHEVIRSRPFELDDLLEWTHALAGRPVGSLFNHVWWQALNARAAERGASVMLTAELGNFTFSFGAAFEPLADLLRRGRLVRFAGEAAALRRAGVGIGAIAHCSLAGSLPAAAYKALVRLARPGNRTPRDLTFLHPRWAAPMAERHRAHGWDERPAADSRAHRWAMLRMADSGSFRKLALARWGVDERDPLADSDFIRFCLSLPAHAFLDRGTARPAARRALEGRVPPMVLDHKLRGMQSVDWHLLTGPDQVARLLARLPKRDGVVDYAALEAAVADWPRHGFEAVPVIHRYQFNLFRALAAGHFAGSACGTPGPRP